MQRELKHWNVPELEAAIKALDNNLYPNVTWSNAKGEYMSRKDRSPHPTHLKVVVRGSRHVAESIKTMARFVSVEIKNEVRSEGESAFVLVKGDLTIIALFHA